MAKSNERLRSLCAILHWIVREYVWFMAKTKNGRGFTIRVYLRPLQRETIQLRILYLDATARRSIF